MDNFLLKLKKLFDEYFFTISLYSRQIAGTITLIFIAKYLSIYDYGILTSYKSIAAFCFMFANMEYANYILVSSKAKTKEVRLKISLFLINAIFIAFFIIFFSIFFNLESHFFFFLIVIQSFFDGTFFALILPYFQATKKFNTISLINIIYSLVIIIIAIISYICKLSLEKFLILNISLGFINFLQCTYYSKINYILTINHFTKFLKMLDKSILDYIMSNLSGYLYSQITSLYVAIFFLKEQAALYFASATIANTIGLITAAQTQKMLPELINSNIEEVKLILKKNIINLGIILFIIFTLLIFHGKILLKLIYSQDYYINAYPILIGYFLANISMAFGTIYGIYLTAIGKQNLKTKVKVEATIVTILCLFYLHKQGILGVMLTLLISCVYASLRLTISSIILIKRGIVNEKRI